MLAVICIQQKQDHRPQQYIVVAAFSVIVNQQRTAATRSNRRILTLHQLKDQNKNDDDSPLFYNDFDGFNSDDIYVTNAKDKTKATDQAMDVDDDSDDDDSENDSIVNENSLGDWRSFRRRLATQERQGVTNNSITSSFTTDTTNESLEQSEQLQQNPSLLSSSNDNKKGMTTTTIKKTKSPNELLFEQQNDKLAQEYYQDSWAHEIATVCIFLTCYHSFFALDHLADNHFPKSANNLVPSPK